MALALTALFRFLRRTDVLPAWLIAINVVAGLTYLYDKAVAGTGRVRVPERVLHALTMAGGTPAAFGAMRLLRHKTADESFQRHFWLILAAQVCLVTGYLVVVRPLLAGAAQGAS